MFAEVLVNVPVDETFWYSVGKFENQVKKYYRVEVIFSHQEKEGIVINLSEKPLGKKLGEIKKVIDKEEVFSDEQMELAKFISNYFTCSLSEAVFMMIPNARKVVKTPSNLQIPEIIENTVLTTSQENVYKSIKNTFNKSEIFLLYGVASSGKTEIYKKLIRDVLNQGKSALLLVPEISLTPQLIDKFKFIPNEIMSTYHSMLTNSERFNIYHLVKKGIKKFVIGPRSSVFLPFKDLGIIIVDEFHESSYKSSSTPRYSTKKIVEWISKRKNIPVVFGSATPPVEDFYLAKQGKYKLLELKEKFSKHQKVEVEVIDTKTLPKNYTVAPKIISEINEKIKKNQQVIVIINRRGFSNLVKCNNCGFVPTCPNCDITLTYHKFKNSLECHYCGYKEEFFELCKECKNGKILDIGIGTEKAEETIKNIFEKIKITRVDLDTIKEKETYNKIYQLLKKGEINVIVGTQIISKGLDIPQVNLVCILFPEIILRLPDFYSSERTFNLLLQSIGRAGRRDEIGKAIIQTSDTEHYSIKTAILQDYEEFYKNEIERREKFEYPPFWYITKIIFRSEKEKNCIEIGRSAKILLDSLAYTNRNIKISQLLPAPIKKISGNYRYQLIVKSKDENLITKSQEIVYKNFKNKKDVYVEIDRDPISLL